MDYPFIPDTHNIISRETVPLIRHVIRGLIGPVAVAEQTIDMRP
jgi:hypothetical protein